MRWMYTVNFMDVLSYRVTERYEYSVCFLFQKKKKVCFLGVILWIMWILIDDTL